MYTGKDKNINNWDRISAGDYLQAFLNELSMREHCKVVLNTDGQVIRIDRLLQPGAINYYKSLQSIHKNFSSWYEQGLKFTTSNLGKGYIVYFVCNKCGRRSKFLYYYQNDNSHSELPICRLCCGIKYPQPRQKQRRLSRLLNRDYLSTEHKYRIIKDAGITIQDVRDSEI
jgi:hypothetical protein